MVCFYLTIKLGVMKSFWRSLLWEVLATVLSMGLNKVLKKKKEEKEEEE